MWVHYYSFLQQVGELLHTHTFYSNTTWDCNGLNWDFCHLIHNMSKIEMRSEHLVIVTN